MLSSQSWNGYGYVLGNPLMLVDPTGTDPACGPGRSWTGEGCSGSDAGLPSYYDPYQVYSSNGSLVNTGSMLGKAPISDLLQGEASYLGNVRSVVGWVSGDDPIRILAFYGVDQATKEVDGTALQFLNQILNNANCSGLLNLGNGTSPLSLIPMMKIGNGAITNNDVDDPEHTMAVISGNQVTINSYASNGILPPSPFGTLLKGQPIQAAQTIIHEMLHFAYGQFGPSAVNPGPLGLKWVNNDLNDPVAEGINNTIVQACGGGGAH